MTPDEYDKAHDEQASDPRSIEEKRAEEFYLSDIWETPTVKEITERLQAKHPKEDDDTDEGDWPDAYFEELNEELVDLFKRASVLAEAGELPADLN